MQFPMQQPNQIQVQPQAQQPPDPEAVAGAKQHLDVMMDGLIKLVSMPKGELNKKEVFDEASDMIARGAFGTPQSKQQLISELANLPDDDEGIRKVLGQQLLKVGMMSNHIHGMMQQQTLQQIPQQAALQGQQNPQGPM